MNGLRNLIHVVFAFLLMTFALPGMTATKQFNVTLQGIGANGSVTATFNNLSSGNSVIKSETLTVPPGSGYLITAASTVSPFVGVVTPYNCATFPCASIQVNYADGIPPTTPASLQLTVSGASSASCSASGTWLTAAYTGNNVGGSPFNYTGALPVTYSLSGCTLGFLTQPTNSQVNTTITSVAQDPTGAPVKVALFSAPNTVATFFTGSITLTNAGPGTGTLTGGGPINAVSGVAIFPALKLDAAGNYALTAGSSGITPVNSSPFTIYSGILQCGDDLASNFTNPYNVAPDQPGYSTGYRGVYNKDGSTCIKVPYTFTNTILTNDQVHLSWDTSVQANPAFLYSLNWRLRNVEPATTGNPAVVNPLAGWTTAPRPQVAWLNDGSGNPAFVPGLACVSGKLPAPYGTLPAGDLAANATQVTITGIAANPGPPANPYAVPVPGAPSVPDVPFPIVIANKTGVGVERMTAISMVGSPVASGGTFTITYNVTRGTPTEGMSQPAVHAGGARVMSTPLPIIPNDPTTFPAPYTPQTQANMCIAQHGFDSFALGPDGKVRLLYFTTVIDIGDGFVRVGQQ
jgi:hypothetical protein